MHLKKMQLVYLLTSIMWIHIDIVENAEVPGYYVGCFRYHYPDNDAPDFRHRVDGTAAAQTVESCLAECLKLFFRFIGLMNGQACWCGSSFGSQGAALCPQTCYGNSSQFCGGFQALSVYSTGRMVPGPPKRLIINQTDETLISLTWEAPSAPNGALTDWTITATMVETFSQAPVSPRSWTYPVGITRARLLGLTPATRYNITICVANPFGIGPIIYDLVWTHIAEPTPPESPEVVKKGQSTITIKLKPVINEFGPVSKYKIVVSTDERNFFDDNCLKSWNESQNENLTYYITAELCPKEVLNETEFVVGDGKRYNCDSNKSWYNVPLAAKYQYHVSLGVVSSFQGITKTSYSSTSPSHNGIILLYVPTDKEDDASEGFLTFLKIAIVISGLLLVISIVVFLLIRRKYGGNHYRRRDQQELNIRGAVTEVENSAFVYDEYLPEEEERKVDYYDMLHQRIWNIPRNFLDIWPEVLSEGSFGTIYRGTVQRKSHSTDVAIYAILDSELATEDKRNMLEGLDILVRGGDHYNTLSLTGTCESQDTLYIVMEYHPATLKDVLLQSRCLQHGEQPKSRFCSLSESAVFEFIVGIAQGMDFLASKKIVHKQLSCSNVLMADGVIPKITGFGVAQFNRTSKKQDYTRWSAQEVLARRIYVTKSDVWSFGVLVWEVCALGGTPYRQMASEQVAGAILRGLRLHQLGYVGDSLYQFMLQCWQIDVDERPSFPQILTDLNILCSDSELNMELNFNVYRDFQYEAYSENLERY